MKKILGILTLLMVLCAVIGLLSDRFATPYNLQNTFRLTSMHGVLAIGAAFVIISGGIDL